VFLIYGDERQFTVVFISVISFFTGVNSVRDMRKVRSNLIKKTWFRNLLSILLQVIVHQSLLFSAPYSQE